MANNFNFIDDTTLDGVLWESGLLASPNPDVTIIRQIGDLLIKNGSDKTIDGQLDNEGNINHISVQSVRLNFSAVLNNLTNYDLNGIISSSYNSSSFNNAGILTITELGGLIDAVFNNTGAVNLDPASRLTLGGEGISDNGIFNLGHNSTLLYDAGNSDIFNGNTYTLTNNSQIKGTGEFIFESGVFNLEVSQGVSIADTVILTLNRDGTFNVDDNWTLVPITNWNGGTIETSGIITNNGTLNIGNIDSKNLKGQLDNHGDIIHENSTGQGIRLDFGTVLNNFTKYELNGTISSSYDSSSFNNAGILTITELGGAIDAVFNNTGTVNLDPASRLTLGGNGISDNGIFNLGHNSTLLYDAGNSDIFNGNTYTLTNNSQITGNGELNINSGTINLEVSQGASIDVDSLTIRAGTLNVDQDWILPEMTTIIGDISGRVLGHLNIDGNLTLSPTTVWRAGIIESSGIITNNGLLELQPWFTALNDFNPWRILTGQLDNHGIITHEDSLFDFLELTFGSILNNFNEYELNGLIRSDHRNSAFNNGTDAILNVVDIGGGFIDAIFNNKGIVNIDPGSRLTLGADGISNGGIFNLENGSILKYDGGTTSSFDNGNTYILTNNSQINGTGELLLESGFLNLEVSQGASIADTIILTLNRDGTFNVDDDWTLVAITNWNGGTLQTSGVITNNGTLNIGNRDQKNLEGQLDNYGDIIHNNSFGQSLWLNSGAVINNFANYELYGTISSGYDSSIFNNSGELSGQGIIGVSVNNSGDIDVGNFNNEKVGRLTIDGNYLETNSSLLNFELGGYNSGIQYDQLDINGLARFDGTLNVSLINGFLPTLGDSFELIKYDDLDSLSELDFTGLTIDSNYEFLPEFSNNTLTLTVVEKTGDRFESNNTRNNATSLTATNGTIEENNLSIHNEQDIDWFSFNLDETANSNHFARINFDNNVGDLDIALYNSIGKLVNFSNGFTNQENISLDGLATGNYFLEVSGFDGAIAFDYDLIIQVPVDETISSHSPTDIILSNNTIDENQPKNTTIGTLSTIDLDTEDTFTYSLVSGQGDTDNNLFTIDGHILKTDRVFDFETQNAYSIRVQTTDSGNNTYQERLTININDVEETDPNIITGNHLNLGEADTITLDHNLQTITLDHTYKNPVIFAPGVSFNGNQLATPRITNVTDSSFDIYLQEPVNEDGSHTSETLSYLVFEAGTYQLSDGTLVEVGTLNTDATVNLANTTLTPWQTIEFDIDFAQTPVIFSQVQTDNESDLVRTRQQNASADGFEVVMEEDEIKGRNSETHLVETIGYIAIASGSGNSNGVTFQGGSTGNNVTHELSTINFGGEFNSIPHFLANIATYDGPDPSALRFQNLTANGVEVTLQEDTSFDSEINHTTEVVNYLAFEGDNGLQGTAYDPLTGNRAIIGTDNDDYLLGLAENDTRIGQGGSDVFVLESNQGTDTINDFELGVDLVGLTDNLTFGSLDIMDTGNDTSVMFGNQALAIIKGVQSNDLTSNHFVEVTL